MKQFIFTYILSQKNETIYIQLHFIVSKKKWNNLFSLICYLILYVKSIDACLKLIKYIDNTQELLLVH